MLWTATSCVWGRGVTNIWKDRIIRRKSQCTCTLTMQLQPSLFYCKQTNQLRVQLVISAYHSLKFLWLIKNAGFYFMTYNSYIKDTGTIHPSRRWENFLKNTVVCTFSFSINWIIKLIILKSPPFKYFPMYFAGTLPCLLACLTNCWAIKCLETVSRN